MNFLALKEMKEALEVAVFDLISPVGLIASFLFIWFKTDFLVSYLKLMNFNTSEYEERSIDDPDLLFCEFLACKYYDKKFIFFIFKLLSCPFCLAAWLSLGVSLMYSLKLIGVYYALSLLLFKFLEKSFFSDD